MFSTDPIEETSFGLSPELLLQYLDEKNVSAVSESDTQYD
jgi:hypothetical protein